MKAYKIAAIVAAVVSFGIILGLVTNYIVRRNAAEPEIGLTHTSPIPKSAMPVKTLEPENQLKPIEPAAKAVNAPPMETVQDIPGSPAEGGEAAYFPPEIQEPVEENIEPVEMPLPGNTNIPVPPSAPVPDNTAASSAPQAGMLPVFVPVASKTGPVSQVSNNQVSANTLPGPATPVGNETSSPVASPEEITKFIPQGSATGPTGDQKTEKLPVFTPIGSKTGPVKTE